MMPAPDAAPDYRVDAQPPYIKMMRAYAARCRRDGDADGEAAADAAMSRAA